MAKSPQPNLNTAPGIGRSAPIGVAVRSVSKSFPQGGQCLEVLHDLSLIVPAGSFVTILGPSGSGKSTLLSIIAGLEEPTEGEVTLLPEGASSPLQRRLGTVGFM